MIHQSMKYCAHCGGKLQSFNEHHFRCTNCGTVSFQNPVPAMCALIIEHGRLLYTKRARPPKQGYWDFPGGFLEPGETVESATARECKEELGITAKVTGFLCTLPSVYLGENYRSTVLNVYVFCQRVRGTLKPADDVSGFAWFPLNQPPKKLAFPHMKKALRLLRARGD